MLDLAVLGLLKEGDLHGYELNKRLKTLVGGYATSFGALYPALARLERRGWVTSSAEIQEAAAENLTVTATNPVRRNRRRNNRAESGRNRKVYHITAAGEDHLLELLQDDANNERRFRLQLAFCRFLPPERRLWLFELRRAHLVHLQAIAQRSPEQSLDRYVYSLFERDRERLESDLAWLDRLIAQERSRNQNTQNPNSEKITND
ncbi:MAG: helix-turn-helix transcriptional regulator [Acidimicrobiia bacterium]|nr:helix-turn-helix transcriptional regulator [Acidimicrobiia bacterium]MYC58077.1 helix-turn-helix transcriptional regulator [Acidimicrobiia bacterium]MYG93816.1 helix-turn-helix transcriptional regulator [Acidimicrobiia bacterium]MYI30750.1 helix-turn-helix transcriptional regulator [Acidimicrobiia bacterium]